MDISVYIGELGGDVTQAIIRVDEDLTISDDALKSNQYDEFFMGWKAASFRALSQLKNLQSKIYEIEERAGKLNAKQE